MKLTEITATSPKEIAERFCKEYLIREATIHNDGVIDADDDVIFHKNQFEKFPVKFGHAAGDFIISGNKLLTSLKGCPTSIDGNFNVESCNNLTSLEHGPIEVQKYYQCNECINLQSFEHVPPDFTGIFWGEKCHQIKNLKGLPKKLKGLLIESCTNLISLEGIPEIITDKHLIINSCLKLTSLDYLPKEIIDGIFEMSHVNQIKNLLALFDIGGNFKLKHDNDEIANIINKHLKNPDRDEGKIKCRQELRDTNYGEYARVK